MDFASKPTSLFSTGNVPAGLLSSANQFEISARPQLGVDNAWKTPNQTPVKFQCYYYVSYTQIDPSSFKGYTLGSSNSVSFRDCYFEEDLAQA